MDFYGAQKRVKDIFLLHPPVWSTLIIALFLFWHTAYLPLWLRLLLILPPVLLNYVIALLLWLHLRRRLDRPDAGPFVEFVFCIPVFVLTIASYFFSPSPGVFVFLILFSFWLSLQAFLQNRGNFYTAFVGLVIFISIILSYRLIHEEVEQILRFRLYAQRSSERTEKNVGDKIEVLKKKVRGYAASGDVWEISFPEGIFPHRDVKIKPEYRLPLEGRLLLLFSNAKNNPVSPPLFAFYALPKGPPIAPGDLKESLDLIMGHMRRRGEITDIGPLKVREVSPPRSRVTLRGLFQSFRTPSGKREMRAGIYILNAPGGGQYLIYIREPAVKSLSHHPDMLYMLYRLNIQPANNKAR